MVKLNMMGLMLEPKQFTPVSMDMCWSELARDGANTMDTGLKTSQYARKVSSLVKLYISDLNHKMPSFYFVKSCL